MVLQAKFVDMKRRVFRAAGVLESQCDGVWVHAQSEREATAVVKRISSRRSTTVALMVLTAAETGRTAVVKRIQHKLLDISVHPCVWLALLAVYELDCLKAILTVYQVVIIAAIGFQIAAQLVLEIHGLRYGWATDGALVS